MNPVRLLLLGGARIPGVYNFTPAKLAKWRTAAGAVRSGAARAKLAIIGDSTSRGMGSNPADLFANTMANSYPTQLAALLTAGGLPALAHSFFSAGTSTAIGTTDPRVTLSGGWAASAVPSLGGNMLTSAAAGTLSFLPTSAVDTFDIYTPVNTSLGVVTANINGGATLATITEGGTKAVAKTTVSGSLASNTLNVVWSSGSAFLLGLDAYTSASKSVSVMNMGWSGATIASYMNTGAAWAPSFVLPYIAPDLTILCLTINDWVGDTGAAAFKTNTQTLITTILGTGSDLVLMVGAPSKVTSATAAVQQQYISAYYDLAATNDLPLIDLPKIFVSQETANLSGGYFDALHPTATGYGRIAAVVSKVLLAAS